MGSKRRVNRVRRHSTCGNKRAFDLEVEARSAVWQIRRYHTHTEELHILHGDLLVPYRCPYCSKFHIGHRKPRPDR